MACRVFVLAVLLSLLAGSKVLLGVDDHERLFDVIQERDTGALDRALAALRSRLESEHGRGIALNLEVSPDSGPSVLDMVLDAGYCPAVQVLLDHGLDLRHPEQTHTALMYCAIRGDDLVRMTRCLLELGADANVLHRSMQTFALLEALDTEGLCDERYLRTVQSLAPATCQELLNHGIRSPGDVCQRQCASPLAIACRGCKTAAIIRTLCSSGAAVTADAIRTLCECHPGSLANFCALLDVAGPVPVNEVLAASDPSTARALCPSCGDAGAVRALVAERMQQHNS